MECYFKTQCRYQSEYCPHNKIKVGEQCHYIHIGRNIIKRDKRLFAVEILNHPFDLIRKHELNDHGSPFSSFVYNSMLIELASKINQIQDFDKQFYFIKFERKYLLDNFIIAGLLELNKVLKAKKSELVLELNGSTLEESAELCDYTTEAEYRVKDSNVLIALGSFQYDSCVTIDDTKHDFVKLDMKHVNKMKDHKGFIDWLYFVSSLGIKLIAEKIENDEDFHFALSLPFEYFQFELLHNSVSRQQSL
ncbi:EAL domain-containing protein [Shewanella fidelis]|uniref:EAL domain-containing protein n=1 Tax=Shewanella fidelis TaxID=173509 RepID=UPI00048B6D09|nr:EAL domain-containing protein [Shewanella fidelis]